MQGEGKRPCSQPLHEQLSPPAGIHPLSTPPSSLTTPLPLKKKKLLKVILKSPPTPNPNRLSPSLSSSPSSPPPPSPSSLSTHPHPLLPPHHSHLQHHQLHHHQQLLLQQQHLHKQKLLHQQTQQLASELQLKLHQQHLLQQEHPKLLEQFKQQLQQEQICASSPDLQGNLQQPASSGSRDRRRNLKGQSPQQEPSESQEKGRSTQEERRNASSGRRRGRSRDFSCDVLPEEQSVLRKSRFHSEEEANFGHSLQGDAHKPIKEFCPNGQERSFLQMQENIHRDGEPSSKQLKVSEQPIEGNVRNPLRSPIGQRNKVPISGYNGVPHLQKPLSNGLLSSPRLACVSSSVALLDASDTKKLHHAVNSAVPIVPHLLAKPVSEGLRHKDGTATGPLSKTLGGSGNTSVPGRKMLRGILDKLQKKDSYGAFSEPVDAKEVPDYYDVIKEPMDFGTMRKRISSGFYTSLGLFEKDIFTICSNAMTFNATGTVYHRQARAIKAAAERILEPLKTSGSAGADEGPLKQKVGVPQVKKSHKKKQPWKPWTSDYVSEPSPNLDGRGAGRASASHLADSYYVDWQAGIGQTSNKMNSDDKDDAMGYLAKSLGLNEGRRFLLNDESRRGTYKPNSSAGSGSLVSTVGGGPLQFVPAAFQLDFSYARSLARFAADLGPDVWKVAGEKIRRALPMGVPFGPGWVGQREAPGRSFSLMNKSPPLCSTEPQGKPENMSNEVGVFATADVERVGNSCATGSGSGAADSKGLMIVSDRNPMATEHRVNERYVEEPQLSEPPHFSQAAAQVSWEDGMRNAQHVRNCDGDQGVRRKEFSYPYQATCQGGSGETDLPPICEGDVVLIPGRDLEGRGCVDYKNTQLQLNSGSALISTPVALIEGVQPRLNEDG